MENSCPKIVTQSVREISELRHSQTISFERDHLERSSNGSKILKILKLNFGHFMEFNSFETFVIVTNLDWFGQEIFKPNFILAKCC